MGIFLIEMNPEVIEENLILLEVRGTHVGTALRLFLNGAEDSSDMRHHIVVLATK